MGGGGASAPGRLTGRRGTSLQPDEDDDADLHGGPGPHRGSRPARATPRPRTAGSNVEAVASSTGSVHGLVWPQTSGAPRRPATPAPTTRRRRAVPSPRSATTPKPTGHTTRHAPSSPTGQFLRRTPAPGRRTLPPPRGTPAIRGPARHPLGRPRPGRIAGFRRNRPQARPEAPSWISPRWSSRSPRSVSEGLSNKDVAAQCLVSPSTVGFHLRNVFTKLGVSSRGELSLQPRPRLKQQRHPARPLPTAVDVLARCSVALGTPARPAGSGHRRRHPQSGHVRLEPSGRDRGCDGTWNARAGRHSPVTTRSFDRGEPVRAPRELCRGPPVRSARKERSP